MRRSSPRRQLGRRERARARERARPPRRPRPPRARSRPRPPRRSSPPRAPRRWSRRIGSFCLPVVRGDRLAVGRRVALVVAAQPVRQALEQHRPAAGAGLVRGSGRRRPTPPRRRCRRPSRARSRTARPTSLTRSIFVCAERGVNSAKPLFSHTSTSGSAHSVARFTASCEVPGLDRAVAEEHDRDLRRCRAAAPRARCRARSGRSRRRRRWRPAARARHRRGASTRRGRWQRPPARPISSASTRSSGAPLAIAWPCARWPL